MSQTKEVNAVNNKVHLFQTQLKVSQIAVGFLIEVRHPTFELKSLNLYFV